MITTRYYLDCRATKPGNEAPLMFAMTKNSKTALINTGIRLLPTQWDKKLQRITDRPDRYQLNNYITTRKMQVDGILRQMSLEGRLVGLTPTLIKRLVLKELDPDVKQENLFVNRFRRYAESRRTQRTREIYIGTLQKIMQYDRHADLLNFNMINRQWVESFRLFLERQGLARNTININLRNLRAVFNEAIDDGLTVVNVPPTRKVDMRPDSVKKRSVDVQHLREIFARNVEPFQRRYLDYFKLTFFLIGINPVDLLHLTKKNLHDGRVIYTRAKTGREYDIKIEPEAQEIFDRYRGQKYLLWFLERYKDYKPLAAKINDNLKVMGGEEYPHLSIYWARHTWATIAYELEIPDATIAAALGHSHGNSTTAIYIDKSVARVDEANRRVIDYVLYDKK